MINNSTAADVEIKATDVEVSDDTAALYGKDAGATVDEVLQATATIQGEGAPTTATAGSIGQKYWDTVNSNLYICTNVSGSVYTWTSISAGVIYKQQMVTEIITESRDWTCPEGIINNQIHVRLFGGGGGACYWTTSDQPHCPGGGGGYMTTGVVENIAPGAVIPITIGAGGIGADRSSHSFTNGGATSFGTYLSADGGLSGGRSYSEDETGQISVTINYRAGGDGGTGGGGYAGDGSGSSYAKGGNASYGGGGGGSGNRNSIQNNSGGNGGTHGGGGGGGSGECDAYTVDQSPKGGNGGMYGGGGGGGARDDNFAILGGQGGTYGGNGGDGGSSSYATAGSAGTNTIGLDIEYTGEGLAGTFTPNNRRCGGSGGGGYGGNGGSSGNRDTSSNAEYCGGGGGGGYGGNGGNGGGSSYSNRYGRGSGGGGGGYGANGGNGSSSEGGGGGGGYAGGHGGNGSAYGGYGGGYGQQNFGRGGGTDPDHKDGKSGICILTYYILIPTAQE